MRSWPVALLLLISMLCGLPQIAFAAETYIPMVSAPPVEEAPTPAPVVLQDGVYEFDNGDIWLTIEVVQGGTKGTAAAFLIDKTAQLPAYCRPVGTVFNQTRSIEDGFVRFQDADPGRLVVYADMKCTALSSTSASCFAVYYASGAGLGYGCFSTTEILTLRP